HAHAVGPIAVERGDRALAAGERIRTLTEARPAPRLADLPSHRLEHLGDALAAEARIRHLDLPPHAARPREDHELAHRAHVAALASGTDHRRRREQVVVAAIGARTDQRLV